MLRILGVRRNFIGYIRSECGVTVNDELERMQKEAVMAGLKGED